MPSSSSEESEKKRTPGRKRRTPSSEKEYKEQMVGKRRINEEGKNCQIRSHHGHKRKDSDRTSDSSSSSELDRDIAFLTRLTEAKKRKAEEVRMRREEARRQKEVMKATESLEEKRMRRLMKKELKERRRKEMMGWDSEYLHYTNSDNPFGDSSLLSTFVWDKKLAKEGLVGVSQEQLELRNRQKMEENRRELEKVKKRRLERELERQRREEEMSRMQRSKEAVQFQEWAKQEDQFHLEQARLRSKIRIQDGRAKPIDLLAKYIDAEDEVDAIEMHEPYIYLSGLRISDLEDLLVDIKVYMELEKSRNLDYWNDITLIVNDQLLKLRKTEKDSRDAVLIRDAVNQSVLSDIASVFKGKTVEQLEALEGHIKIKLEGDKKGIDVGYWESLMSQLRAYMAKVRLRNRHQDNLKRKLEYLKSEVNKGHSVSSEVESRTEERESISEGNKREVAEDDARVAYELMYEEINAYEAGHCSPKYVSVEDLEPGTIVINEEDDYKRLEFARAQVLGTGDRVESVLTAEEKALQKEARKGMTEDEVEFSVESVVDSQVYLWSDKYRPRKPRYFNRVHTGFEWNKYNQTHYDMDNPPPKIVQGYKFNIFYPDLIDKNSTPEYFITPCSDNSDFAILRFHAGPPYEDIAFKIVHREWEYSYKKGFRCQFHNNIFQLWFHFKRYRYRR